jgi:hypothetical protein
MSISEWRCLNDEYTKDGHDFGCGYIRDWFCDEIYSSRQAAGRYFSEKGEYDFLLSYRYINHRQCCVVRDFLFDRPF